MKPKILVIPARRHIIEAYTEYIFRYLGSDFHFEMGYPPTPPYHNIRERVWKGETSPLHKNPDEFDLIYPHFATHTFLVPEEKYAHKIAVVQLEPAQGPKFAGQPAIRALTNYAMQSSYPESMQLRFGVDTDLFQPLDQVRPDDKVHIGFIGNIQTPRRYMKELFIQLNDIPGIKLDIYPTSWPSHTRIDEIELMGGQTVINNIIDGDKWLSGLPNIYNKMDIFIRCDIDHGYQFSVMEAAACGVPVITTDSGISKELTDADGGILIDCGDRSWKEDNLKKIASDIRKAVIRLRDNKEERWRMGNLGRDFVIRNYEWKKWIPEWRKFFQKGLENAH